MPHTRTLFTTLFLLALAAQTPAQTSAPAPAPTPRAGKGAAPRAPRKEADPLVAQRRAQAVALLTSLASEAAGFRDETLRARAQARAADALWETDAELARQLFRRAWDAADAADRESARRLEEEMRAQRARGGPLMTSTPPDLRSEVLRLAARRDRTLGEELLSQLNKATRQEAEEASAATKSAPSGSEHSSDTGQRLGLAQQLLEEGDVERAVQFAEPALAHARMQSLAFLSALREKDAAAADRRYAALLARAEADPASDANTVSLLSSYAYTPFAFFTAYRGGATGLSILRGGVAAPDLASGLRASFLRTAARILLRPQTTEEYERTSAGRAGAYLVIRRLLPHFERHAPDLTAALNARAAALQADVPASLRAADAEGEFARGTRPEGASARDEVQAAHDRAARASGVAERDEIYAAAAVNASWKGDPRAQELLAKIVDLEMARRVRPFADFAAVRAALERKEAEAAVARAAKGELTNVQRAWAYERAAELVAASDRARAVSLLEEAGAAARRIDNTDPDRARTLVAVATRYEKIDRARAWEFMYEAARAANAAQGFTGEDGRLSVQFRTSHGGWMTDFNVQEFDLADIMAALGAEDWERAVQLAESFTGEAARVAAVVSLARTALARRRV